MALFFAYGLFMDAAHMAVVAPRHAHRGTARLEGWGPAVTRHGLATLVKRPGATVEGVLWEVSARDEPALDRFEGVDRGLYRRHRLALAEHGPALVYVACDPPVRRRARPGYGEAVVSAAMAARLSQPYVRDLRAVLLHAADVPDDD